jgi:hypothetical protein
LQINSEIKMLEQKQVAPVKNVKDILPLNKNYQKKWTDRGYIECEVMIVFLPNCEWFLYQRKKMNTE